MKFLFEKLFFALIEMVFFSIFIIIIMSLKGYDGKKKIKIGFRTRLHKNISDFHMNRMKWRRIDYIYVVRSIVMWDSSEQYEGESNSKCRTEPVHVYVVYATNVDDK